MRATLIIVAAIVGVWLLFLLYLALARPDRQSLSATAKLLPDTLRLLRRLVSDKDVPRSARWPVWLLLAYLAFPLDLVPDFIPILGYADDAILVAVVLRRLTRKAGATKLAEHWPGSPEGLAQLRRALRL